MALTRQFSGKVYHFHAQFRSWKGGKPRADALANRIRNAGGLARVTSEGRDLNKVYIVWSRDK